MARITVMEFERVVRFDRGVLVGILGAGRHRYRRRRTQLVRVDLRERVASVPGQELLTADGVTVKVTLALRYRVVEPGAYVLAAADPDHALYTAVQLALRATVAQTEASALLADRGAVAAQLQEAAVPIAAYGVELLAVAIKDVMLPGDLKRVFAQVTIARQEGLAALERARGESAALRSMANAARAVEANPALLQLRLLQTVEGARGTTVVLTPQGLSPTIA